MGASPGQRLMTRVYPEGGGSPASARRAVLGACDWPLTTEKSTAKDRRNVRCMTLPAYPGFACGIFVMWNWAALATVRRYARLCHRWHSWKSYAVGWRSL